LIRLAEIPPAPFYKGRKYYLRTGSKNQDNTKRIISRRGRRERRERKRLQVSRPRPLVSCFFLCVLRGLERSGREKMFFCCLGKYKNPERADDCWYCVYDLRPPQKAKAFLSPAALEAAGLTGKEKFRNVTARLCRLFFFGPSLRTLRTLREKRSFRFCSF